MEEVNEFNYLGTILCKHGCMEGDLRERTVKGRQVMGALERVMKGRKRKRKRRSEKERKIGMEGNEERGKEKSDTENKKGRGRDMKRG